MDLSDYLTQKNANNNHETNCIYDLYAIINHHGSSISLGHYTAYARTPDRLDTSSDEIGWRLFDDERVVKIENVSQMNTKDCYVLLYRQREHNTTSVNKMESSQLNAGKELNSDSYLKRSESEESEESNDEFFSDNDSKESLDSTEANVYTDLNDID